MVRTCSNTERPCTLSAAQQSRLPHRPVREARSQPEQTSSRTEQIVPAPAGKSAPAPAASIRDGKLCLTLPRGDPGPQGDPGEGLSDNAKALLLSLLAGTALDRDAALAALRAEWGLAEPDDTTPEAADAADAADAAEEA